MRHLTHERRQKFTLPKSFFLGVHLVFQMFQDTWCSNKGILECYPVLSLSDPEFCKFISRSDRVLDVDHSLDLYSDLVLQVCISVLRCFREEWSISAFVKTQAPIYRSLHAVRAQNHPKVSKISPRASRPGVSKRSRKESRSL